jgi:protein gp37
MSATTKIEWTDATWNPVTGCTKVSEGCDNCYAETFAERWRGTAGHYFEQGFDVVLRPDKLDLPLRWKRPRRIFVNSMSDLFHDEIRQDYIAEVLAVVALAPRHTFQLLTKRHARMRSLLSTGAFVEQVRRAAERRVPDFDDAPGWWPLPNLWLGVSVETQQWADIRIPALLDTPAAVRWLSCEPLLGPVDLTKFLHLRPIGANLATVPMPLNMAEACGLPALHWVVAGGESGSGARPMHPDWARSLRDQCGAAGVPFLHKQNGQWAPVVEGNPEHGDQWVAPDGSASPWEHDDSRVKAGLGPWVCGAAVLMRRARWKSAAGRLLDGREWNEYPADHTAVPA